MDTCRASRYFVRRRKNYSKIQELVAYSTFPKLEMVCDCRSHLILCADVVVGPTVDLKLIALQSGTFGGRFARQFAPLTFGVALAASCAVGTMLL